MKKSQRICVLVAFAMIIQSCYRTNSAVDKVSSLYQDKLTGIDSLDVDIVFIPKNRLQNRLQKLENLFVIKSLYNEEKALLNLKNEEYKEQIPKDNSRIVKMEEIASKMSQNRAGYRQVILDISQEIKKFKTEDTNSSKVYVIEYRKNQKSKHSLILDDNSNLIFTDDPLLDESSK